ncbi:MAG: GAP family protein [Mycobacterium sp.]|uniref:GAP family protein n=1 Tax=Mycobacterium sp. TaxID=1785 RepID=UPI003C43A7F8
MIWGTVLALALVVAPDPTRLAIVALLISRPRPLVNLLVFWLGGMASGTAIALGSVMLLHDFALMVTQHVASAFAALKSGYVGIVIGACALLIAALLSARLRQRATVAIPSGDSPVLVSEPSPANAFSRLSTRARGALVGGCLWVPFVAGFGSAPPHVEYQIAIAAILTSGAPMVTQISAAMMFTVVVLAAVEIPLVSHLVTPERTYAVMLHAHDWMRAHRRQLPPAIAAVTGVFLLTSGIGSI